MLVSLVLTSALPSFSSPGLGIPISPCSFSLSMSNPTGPMLQHLLRLSPGACPEVMSHFGNGGSHLKRAVCHSVFHRRVISLSPPREVPISHQEALHQRSLFPPGTAAPVGKRAIPPSSRALAFTPSALLCSTTLSPSFPSQQKAGISFSTPPAW